MNNRIQKKILDIVLSLLLLILCSPLIIVLLTISYIITKRVPVFIQERKLSLDGKKIKMIKIRTLKGMEQKFETVNNSCQVLFRHDLRKYVPPFCRWLRKSGLDEITQLINVLKGEMSLVGPRPLTITDLEIMKNDELEIYRRRERIKSKPGITGYWQLFGDRNKGLENIVALDEYYEKRKSFLFDLRLLFFTTVIVIKAKHSDSIIDEQKVKTKISPAFDTDKKGLFNWLSEYVTL